jgi:hypothetical protein
VVRQLTSGASPVLIDDDESFIAFSLVPMIIGTISVTMRFCRMQSRAG